MLVLLTETYCNRVNINIYQWLSKNDEMEVLEFKKSGSRYQIQTGVKCHPLPNFAKTEYITDTNK